MADGSARSGQEAADSSGGPARRLRVAVTRSLDDNRSLVDRLTDCGAEVVVVPLVEVVEPADGGRALVAAAAQLERYRWVVLTSANGVRSLVAARSRLGVDEGWPPTVEVAVVGPTTAAAATAAGLPVALVPDRATASDLVERFPPADPDTGSGRPRVLAPLAELAGPTIEDGLAAKGWRVDRVEAYRATAPAEVQAAPTAASAAIADPGNDLTVDPRVGSAGDPAVDSAVGSAGDPAVDIVTLFSPSVVDRWVDRFGAAGPAAVCIGPATAARATARGLGPVVMADPHTEDGVVEAVAARLGRPTI